MKITRFVLALALAVPPTVAAQNTTVVVHVLAHDAKIIGSGVGGARVTIKNAATGEVLAEGEHMGSTGNTGAIVVDPHVRGEDIYDGAGSFVAHIQLNRPLALEFVAEGPLGYPTALQRASKTLVVVPGDDMTGDGVVLELHGFIVEVEGDGPVTAGSSSARVKGSVRMMCGCPLTSGGLWDADRVQVVARIIVDNRLFRQLPMSFSGEPNTYVADLDLSDVPSGAMIHVVASDPTRQNAGYSPALIVQ